MDPVESVNIPLALVMSIGSTLAGMGGTWAVLRYKVDRAASSATAAHKRMDELERADLRTLTDRVTRLEERTNAHAEASTKALSGLAEAFERTEEQLRKAIDTINGKLDDLLLGGTPRAKVGRRDGGA